MYTWIVVKWASHMYYTNAMTSISVSEVALHTATERSGEPLVHAAEM
jgi:hypothetical protein